MTKKKWLSSSGILAATMALCLQASADSNGIQKIIDGSKLEGFSGNLQLADVPSPTPVETKTALGFAMENEHACIQEPKILTFESDSFISAEAARLEAKETKENLILGGYVILSTSIHAAQGFYFTIKFIIKAPQH